MLIDTIWNPVVAAPVLPTVQTKNAGVLQEQDVFRYGADFYKITKLHSDHVEVWGGSKDPNGSRAFHALRYPDVIERAKPLRKGERWIPTQYAALMLEGRKERYRG